MKKFLIFVFSFIIILGGSSLIFSLEKFSDKKIANAEETVVNDSDGFIRALSKESNYENEDVVIKLGAPIDLAGEDLSGIFNVNKCFSGTFDGNGYSISNITLSSKSSNFGLFPYASGATIKDVKISGDITFNFDINNASEVYAGILVGYGENVTFSNCELDNVATDDSGDKKIDLAVYSNVQFGGLAGKLTYDLNNSAINISNCINYYDIDIDYHRETNVIVGSLVGGFENGYMLNNLAYSNINFTNSLSEVTSKSNVMVGGIVGAVNGGKTNIRNCCYGGNIRNTNDVNGINLYLGGIIGGALTSQTTLKNNINFDYYSDFNLNPSGDNYIVLGEKLKKIAYLNKDFLDEANKEADERNFDPANLSFDFSKIWQVINSQFHLQHFQEFDFSFTQQFDSRQVLESASFSDVDVELNKTSRYNETINIYLKLKEIYYKYYELSSVQLNGNYFEDYELTEDTGVDESSGLTYVKGYTITFNANALTQGKFSFIISPKAYNCIVTVSAEAKQAKAGGITIDNGTSLSYNDVPLAFYSNSNSRKISAMEQGIYVFNYWELYYRDVSGEFSSEPVQFEGSNSKELVIKFGSEPFNREFKLVAYFTDEGAVKVDFSQYKSAMIKSITFSGVVYEGESILVSPNGTQVLELVLNENYILDVDEFTKNIEKLYGENKDEVNTLVISTPETDKNGLTTYRFSINIRYIKDLEDNSLNLSFLISEDKKGSIDSLLWLYICLPIAVALIVLVVVIILLRRRRGGGHKGGSAKVKTKKESYKDLY